MKPKVKKQIASKPFLEMIKDLKNSRAEMQGRVTEFKRELIEKSNDNNQLLHRVGANSLRIEELRHLLKMYKVSDDRKTSDLWKLEKACGITKLPFMEWRTEFEKTKVGKPLKDTIGT